MPSDADKIMFEVYREASYNQVYRVVYFTELEEGERDEKIDAAMSGTHFLNGFIRSADREAARAVLGSFVARLNRGDAGTSAELASQLAPYLAR
jgi:hypothetical protein